MAYLLNLNIYDELSPIFSTLYLLYAIYGVFAKSLSFLIIVVFGNKSLQRPIIHSKHDAHCSADTFLLSHLFTVFIKFLCFFFVTAGCV